MAIDPALKRHLGQLVQGVHVVAAEHAGVLRAFTCHWVGQVSFEEPVVAVSVSRRHDTHPVLLAAGRFGVSLLGADQVEQGQYFGYPGRRFRHVAAEWLEREGPDGPWRVPGCIAWLACEVQQVVPLADHDLVLARVTHAGAGGGTGEALVYAARRGWRAVGPKARDGDVGSVRDRLLARADATGAAEGPSG